MRREGHGLIRGVVSEVEIGADVEVGLSYEKNLAGTVRDVPVVDQTHHFCSHPIAHVRKCGSRIGVVGMSLLIQSDERDGDDYDRSDDDRNCATYPFEHLRGFRISGGLGFWPKSNASSMSEALASRSASVGRPHRFSIVRRTDENS